MNVIARFEITYNQYLDPNGNVTQDLPEFAKNSENLVEMYRLMTLLRVFDAKAVALQRTGKMGTYAGILGQECASVALGSAMRADDVLCPAYREYGAMLQRGWKMSDIFNFWGGDERGNNFANPYDFPMNVPIASQTLHAAGTAVAFKIRKQPRVAVSVCGDGATSQGDFYEAMNLAGDWMLPVVFFVNNNQWAISIPRSAQTAAKTLAQKAIAAGFEGVQVDGNDIIAVRDAVETALAKARDGGGPTLIEAITYRLCDHTTADDAKRYRCVDETDAAWKLEPLIRLRAYLMNNQLWSQEAEDKLLAECAQKVDDAVQEYVNMPAPPVESMLDYLYAKLPLELEEQRAALIEENARA